MLKANGHRNHEFHATSNLAILYRLYKTVCNPSKENASAANLLATKLSFLNLNFMLVWYTYRTYLNRVQIVPSVYFDETSGVTSIQLRSNQVLTKPTQHQNAKNVFINIPPILSNPNEVLMTSYSQELMDEKSFILDDQRTEDGNKFGENNPLSTYAKLLARGHLNGVGNKNFPVAVLYDDWINIHPELQTKGRLCRYFCLPSGI